ncbi:MAG TPA: M48 family metalloprotease [Candidatus Angelobacter sp.]|nr:M48 family metalloprotease [Candidatus Angelobacter sp.]
MRSFYKFFILFMALTMGAALMTASDHKDKDKDKSKAKAGDSAKDNDQSSANDAVTDRIFYSEAKLVENMHKYAPLVETYIQNLKPDKELGSVPESDKYFLGRLILSEKGLGEKRFERRDRPGFFSRVLDRLNSFYKMNYLSLGFMQLVFLNDRFDKDNYELKYLRQQFLGDVRTLVFDVVPKKHVKGPHFLGRIWVEDQDYNIIRFNGTYEPRTKLNAFFHFDSWRVNMQPGLWLPAYVYTEESDSKYAVARTLNMKGQTRLWAYDLKHSGLQTELTNLQIDSVKDNSDSSGVGNNEIVPVQSQHKWEREAEDNVLDRMERAGVLAPDGEVSKVLQTVVNNLEITNNLNIEPDVRCRVLLTTPLESFTVGHTIVISRGLLDVLPDESSLAMVLSRELAHISLGHRLNTKYAFSDRMIFPDEEVFRQIGIKDKESEEVEADQKAAELLQNSPYKDKLASAGLFLRALETRSQQLTWLISPHFGNRMARNSSHIRMPGLAASAPELEARNINQLAALPLGSRIKLDPWDDRVEMQKSKPVALLSVRDKMSFEVTPMFPNLIRFNGVTGEVATKQGNK